MASRAAVEDFLKQKKLAVVGVSRGGKKFGNAIFKELKSKGYRLFPINPKAESIDGERCYPNLKALPELPDGVITVVPPSETLKVLQEAKQLGIKRVWLQQGSESEAAIRFCSEQGLSAVDGECILMFAEPAAFYHKIHRFVWKLLGRLPA